ncbi:MAG: gliding motility-associated C-terminal domain-containing protein [Bacteroidia bacterium]
MAPQPTEFYLVVDEEERVIVTGGTASDNFPLSAGCYQNTYGGGVSDGFVSIIDSAGTGLIASTYVGSSAYDMSFIVGADKNDFVYIFAQTSHTGNLFNVNSPIGIDGGNQFLMKLSPDLGEVVWSSPYGNATGQPDISPTALLVDYCDKIYCSGWGGAVNSQLGTSTFGLPVTADAWQSNTDGSDFYLYVIDDVAENVLYASFLGGTSSPDHVDGGTSRFDRKGVIYQSICAGCGGNSDFPITGLVHSPTNNSFNCNNLIAKFDFESPLTISAIATVSDPLGCAPYTVQFSNTSINADEFSWRLVDEVISTDQNLSYTFNEPGTYEVTLIATSSESCNGADTVSVTINVVDDIEGSLPDLIVCPGNTVELGPDAFDDPYYEFNWFPSTGLSETDVRKPTVTPTESVTYSVEIRVGGCIDTLTQEVIVSTGLHDTLPPVESCALQTVTLGPDQPYVENVVYSWSPATEVSDASIYNPTYYTEEPVNFTLLVEFENGCADTLEQFVEARYDLMDAGPDKEVCAGDTFEIGLPDLTGNFTYEWSPASLLNDNTLPNPLTAVNQDITYTVIRLPLPGTEDCPARDTVTVVTVDPPLALFSFEVFASCTGASVVIDNQSELNDSNVWVFNPGGTNSEVAPVLTVPFNQNFNATLIVANGECRDTMSLSEYIKDFNEYFEPNTANAFSPNADGINDCFNPALQLAPPPYDRAFLECTDLIVYNRWGEVVHNSVNDNEPCWYGTNLNGDDLPEGVYFYIFDYFGEKRTGAVHLRRAKP